MRKRPNIPEYNGPHPKGVKYYIQWDKETGQSYLTEALDDGSERFCNWLPPSFCQCIEERIKAGKFGKVEKYRYG